MSIQVDWQIDDGDAPWTEHQPSPAKPKRKLSRWIWLALTLIAIVAMASAVVYIRMTLGAQLNRAVEPVRQVARLEAQAVAADDQALFEALQDSDDGLWREVQAQRFGRLEREGLPELGWAATGVQPQPGSVSLEPGGARLDMLYQFSVTQPLSGTPGTIGLIVPQYYRQTPSGWVHAAPPAEYWGGWQTRSGKHFAVGYVRRDADLVEWLVPHIDDMLAQVCNSLQCPPQPVYVVFENATDAVLRLKETSNGFDENGFILRLPSPHWLGTPVDARSRDEWARMVGTRVVQALVGEATGRRANLTTFPTRLFLSWELSRAGLANPFITPDYTRALSDVMRSGAWQPLTDISLRARSAAAVSPTDEAMLAFALRFLEQQIGPGTVERFMSLQPLVFAAQANTLLGDVISATLKRDPRSLDPAWLAFLRRQVNLPAVSALPPSGELALWCSSRAVSSIVRVQANGQGIIQTIENNPSPPGWSPVETAWRQHRFRGEQNVNQYCESRCGRGNPD